MGGYKKHNLYTAQYNVNENGVVELPEDLEWLVLSYTGERHFSPRPHEGKIALILNDKKNNFWSVISFLTQEEAKDLLKQLKKFVEPTVAKHDRKDD